MISFKFSRLVVPTIGADTPGKPTTWMAYLCEREKSPTILGQDPCYCYLSHGYAFLLGKFLDADQPVSIAAFLCTSRNIPVNNSFVG